MGESTEYLFADDVYEDAEIKGYRDGSARIALGLQDPVHNYFLIEKHDTRAWKDTPLP